MTKRNWPQSIVTPGPRSLTNAATTKTSIWPISPSRGEHSGCDLASRSQTRRLTKVLGLISVPVLDHLIMGHAREYSFAETGRLRKGVITQR